jgi:hypothetical protein
MSALQEREEHQARLETFDRRFLESYDPDALQGEVQEARELLRQAVAADPVFSAWINYRAAHMRTQRLALEAQSIADDLGIERRFGIPGPGSDRLQDVLTEMLSGLVQARIEELQLQDASDRRTFAASGPAE